jgi:hypothetical protein
MTLKLGYDFTSNPILIRASATGANAAASVVTLRVLISNPGLQMVPVTRLIIAIPVGENVARDLSGAPALPAPSYDKNHLPWDITSAGSTVTITPKAGTDGTMGGAPILFELPGIAVNGVAGTVPITITEFLAQAPKIIDGQSYHLVKQPPDLPVTQFSADPAELTDVDQPVTLHWLTTEAGQNFSYSLHSDDWQPKDCIDGGDCFARQDGVDGVQTPGLAETTTFSLDVIATDTAGHRTVRWTVTTKVRVKVPRISDVSHQVCYWGRVARLHWLAIDAARCSVALNGKVIDDHAPLDTYRDGYWVSFAEAGTHQFSVVAHASSGDAQAQHAFDTIQTAARSVTKLGGGANDMAVSPDGAQMLLNGNDHFHTADMIGGGVTSVPTIYGNAVAIAPNGTLALASSERNIIRLIPLRDGVANRAPITVPDFMGSWYGAYQLRFRFDIRTIAITPDSKFALLSCRQGISVIDIANWTLASNVVDLTHILSPPDLPGSLSITPDGRFALVATNGGFPTHAKPYAPIVIDIAQRQVVPTQAEALGIPVETFITPDSKFAYVTVLQPLTLSGAGAVGPFRYGLYRFDITARRWSSLEPSIARGHFIAFSHDGRLGVACTDSLLVIDIRSQREIPSTCFGGLTGLTVGQSLAPTADRLVLLTDPSVTDAFMTLL